MPPLTPNTQAILLLTAPLILGPRTPEAPWLTPSEYRALARRLQEIGRQPADFLGPVAADVIRECGAFIDPDRLKQLLARGFQLGQAVERWNQRAIWVVSRADHDYPRRLKARLGSQAPALLYGSGTIHALDEGGLAVAGSRHVDQELTDYAMQIGALAARAERPIVSGGARGIDQAAMRGALEAGGKALGVLSESLERQVVTREHRDMLSEGRLVLISPYDPGAGFNAGHAMQRNKIVYALADTALVVSSDVNKGGTWAGAIEQLEKLKSVPVYVRSTGTPQQGLDALRGHGARPWPNPGTPEELQRLLDSPLDPAASPLFSLTGPQDGNSLAEMAAGPKKVAESEGQRPIRPNTGLDHNGPCNGTEQDPAERLFRSARSIIIELADRPINADELARALQVPSKLASTWLERLVCDGVLRKERRPKRYVANSSMLL